jgi:3-methylfumaryl-CoA hydratase
MMRANLLQSGLSAVAEGEDPSPISRAKEFLMSEWDAWIGRSQQQSDVLTPALLARFHATLNSDHNNSNVAPQAIHWCLCTPDSATSDLGVDGHPARTHSPDSFLPPIALPRRMWASSKVEFHAPISAGTAIERVSKIVSITEKSGGSGPLVFAEIAHETKADGTLAVSEIQTVVYREASNAAPVPLGGGKADLSGWQWHRSFVPNEALLFRYSALTFNSHRIHYDAPYAVNDERYRALVVHGPLTATLLLELVQRELGSNSLKSFAFRGQAPAFVGELLHLAGNHTDGQIELAALGSDGRTVMSASAVLA